MTWQPIETAPKDGATLILLNGEGVFVGYYSCADGGLDCWMEDRAITSERMMPTHWRPLPTPPE